MEKNEWKSEAKIQENWKMGTVDRSHTGEKWGYLVQVSNGYRAGALESTASRVGNPTTERGRVGKGIRILAQEVSSRRRSEREREDAGPWDVPIEREREKTRTAWKRSRL